MDYFINIIIWTWWYLLNAIDIPYNTYLYIEHCASQGYMEVLYIPGASQRVDNSLFVKYLNMVCNGENEQFNLICTGV